MTHAPEPTHSTAHTSVPPKSILICDDNDEILELCSVILNKAGYQVQTASGHAEFSQKFDPTAPPHLIILDVQMPEHDGFWIAENLGSGVRVPIIFVTGHDRPVYRLYAPIAGAADYITKPFDPDELLLRVETALKVLPKASSALMQAVQNVSGRHRKIEDPGQA